jgi:hypothetical protein
MAVCGGCMRPIGAEQRRGTWYVLQCCDRCGHTRPNSLASPAEVPVLIKIMATLNPPTA